MDWKLTILIALIAALPGLGALYVQLRKSPAEINYTEANTSEKFEKIARDAAESILAKSDRIKEMESQMEDLRGEIDDLKTKNTQLARERKKLEKRVLKLEEILRAHDIPVPETED